MCVCYLQMLFCSLKFALSLVVDNLQTQFSVHPYGHTSEMEQIVLDNCILQPAFTFYTKNHNMVKIGCHAKQPTNHVPATCVRVCMLFCSAASGSLYSRAWPASTSSSFTFTWFSRSLNNLQAQDGVSLRFNNSYFAKIYYDGLLFFEGLKLFFQLQHLVKTFSSPPLTVLIIHVFIENEIAIIKLH